MGCGMGVIKYLLFIFNFIFVLCGLAILVLGVLVHLGDKNYFNSTVVKDITGDLTFPAITLIVLGTVIFLIAFFGCCGAIRESHCMVITFASLLLTILIIQVAVAIYAFVALKNTGDIHFKEIYGEKIFNKYTESPEDKNFVNFIQEEFQCCGIDGPGDFNTVLRISIPGSCCNKVNEEPCLQTESYQKGCAGTLEDFFKYICAGLGGVALGIAAIELIGIIFALCLANSIKNAERRGYSV